MSAEYVFRSAAVFVFAHWHEQAGVCDPTTNVRSALASGLVTNERAGQWRERLSANPLYHVRLFLVEDVGESMSDVYHSRRSEDGWPLCPRCGEDELWSSDSTEDSIKNCLACGWRPSLFQQAKRRIR